MKRGSGFDAERRLRRQTWSALTGGSSRITLYGYTTGTGDLSSVSYKIGNESTDDRTMIDLAYTYHRDGRPSTVVDALGTRTMGYDSVRRQTSETLPSFYNNGATARKITWKRDTAVGLNGRLRGFQLGTTSDEDFDMEISIWRFRYGDFDMEISIWRFRYGDFLRL